MDLLSQDALIKSANVFTFLFWYALFYRNLKFSRPASDFCVVEDDFEFLDPLASTYHIWLISLSWRPFHFSPSMSVYLVFSMVVL